MHRRGLFTFLYLLSSAAVAVAAETEPPRDDKILEPAIVISRTIEGRGFCLADWNGDGIRDAISCSSAAHGEGEAHIYLNRGTDEAPLFANSIRCRRLPMGRT